MILATHALVGAAIGKNVKNPWLVVLLSLAAHFLLDGFRHGEYFDNRIATLKNTWWKVTLDLTFASFAIFGYLGLNRPTPSVDFNILLGAFFSMLPDLLTVFYWLFPQNRLLAGIKKFHSLAHRYSRFPKHSPERQWTLRNARNDILISALAILLLLL